MVDPEIRRTARGFPVKSPSGVFHGAGRLRFFTAGPTPGVIYQLRDPEKGPSPDGIFAAARAQLISRPSIRTEDTAHPISLN